MYPAKTKDETVSSLKQSANQIQDELSDTAHQVGRKIRHAYDSASNEISHVSDTVTHEIRTNPVRSSAVALGIGVLLGMLIRR